MDKLKEFLKLLNETMEDGEAKTKLVSAFSNVSDSLTSDFDKLKTERKELGKKLDSDLAFKKEIKNLLGLEDEFSLEDLQNAIKTKDNNNADIEAIKAKYEKESNELRSLLESEKTKSNEAVSKLDLYETKNLLEQSGIYSDIIPNARIDFDNKIMDRILKQDGKLFVKGSDGQIKTNITDNTPVKIDSLKDEIRQSYPYLFQPTGKGGMNVPPNQPSGYKGQEKTVDATKYKDSGSFMKDAFASLNN